MSSATLGELLSKPPVALAVGATITVGVLVAFINCAKKPSSSKSSKTILNKPDTLSTTVPATQPGNKASATTVVNPEKSASISTSSKKKKTGGASGESKTVAKVADPSTAKPDNKSPAKKAKAATSAGKGGNKKVVYESDSSDSDSENEKAPSKPTVYEGPKLQSTVMTTELEYVDEDNEGEFQKPNGRKSKPRAPQVVPQVASKVEAKGNNNKSKTNGKAEVTEVPPAKEEIEQPVVVTPTIFDVKVEIETANLSRIIGKQGSTIKSIEEFTKAKVQCPRTPESGEKPTTTTVIIVGTDKKGVNEAAVIVKELNKDGHSSTLHKLQDPSYTDTDVRFFESYKGLLLSCRQKIRTECKVEIEIEHEDQTNKKGKKAEKPVRVIVSGNKDNVIRAKGVLKSLKESFCSPITHPGQQSFELDPKYLEYSGAIIGKHGDHIKNIKKKNVDVYVPKDDENVYETKNITLVGKPENIKEAIAMIDMYIERSKTARLSRRNHTDNLADESERFGVADVDSDIDEHADDSPLELDAPLLDSSNLASSLSPSNNEEVFPELSKSTRKGPGAKL